MSTAQSYEQHISGLVIGYLQNELTENETRQLEEWMNRSPQNKALFEELRDEEIRRTELKEMEGLKERIAAKLYAAIEPEEEKVVPLFKRTMVRWIAAASVVGILFMAYFLMNRTSTTLSTDKDPSTALRTDVPAPDKNRAQIKLADGRIVYLDSAGNGELVDMNGVRVVKTADGRIEYSRESRAGSRELEYNTLTNPRGSIVMHMTLSDGSKVWLNAGSSITYPVAFVGSERNVTINGEAYFEISTKYDAGGSIKQPFIVSKGDVSVTVLGTHFNVNAYEDESEVKVTLLEGSVKVSRESGAGSRESKTIKPGEQAKSTGNGQLTISKDVDTDAVVAWKNGQFSFDNTDLKTVMRQIGRWYDVEIVYEGEVPNEEFIGGTSRQENVSAVLKVLEATGKIKFKVEGKKVIVKK